MKTCGYDLLLQVNEKLLNKTLELIYYTGKLRKSGKISLIDKMPDKLKDFTDIEYLVELRNEPFLDFTAEDTVMLRVSIKLNLIVLSGVHIDFYVDASASAKLNFDRKENLLNYTFDKGCLHDITLNNDNMFNQTGLNELNNILSIIIEDYFVNQVKSIQLPCSVYSFDLPNANGQKIDIAIGDAKIVNNQNLLAGIYVNKSDTDIKTNNLVPIKSNTDIAISLKTDTIMTIAKSWFDSSINNIEYKFDGNFEVAFKNILAKGTDLLTRIISLGFIENKTKILKSNLIYSGKIYVNEFPQIEFEDNNVYINSFNAKLDLDARIDVDGVRKYFIDKSGLLPDKWTKFEDDILKSEKEYQESIFKIKNTVNLNIKNAICTIIVDQQGRLNLKVKDADLDLDLGEKWTKSFTNRGLNLILDFLEKTIIDKLPSFVISPSILLQDLNLIGYTFKLDNLDLDLDKDELTVCADISTNELERGRIIAPNYIANSKSKVIHKHDCFVVNDIQQKNKYAFYSVYDAINNNYKPCKHCLKDYKVK